MRLLLATRNAHKVSEIRDLLKDVPLEVLSISDVPSIPEVEEDLPTIEGNAAKKAAACAKAAGLWALADDTGLEVEALGGAPGVYSARYAGPECSYAANNEKLLRELKGAQDRAAVFRTVMALSDPQGRVTLAEGRLEGTIASAPAGENGFGYDPVFFVPEKGRTYAQMTDAEKNTLSHRFRAMTAMLPRLKDLAALTLALLLCAPAARAGRTDPGQETIWDRIMASQAHRGLRQGSQFLDSKDYESALREFQKAVAANPQDAMSHMMLGVAYYWNGKVDESLQAYQRCLQLDPGNGQAYMLTGISLAWKGEVKPSYEAFKHAASLEPERADIQMNLGSIEETLGLMPEAMEHFRRAVALDAKNPLYHFQLGMLYRKLGRDGDAVDSLRLALRHFSAFEDALLELGAAEERRGDKKAAMHSFRKAVDLKTRDAVARFRLARLSLMAGDVKRAREVLTEAFHLTPEEGGAGLQLSVSYSGGKKSMPGESDPQKNPAAQPPEAPPSSDPLEVFRRNLERVPLEQGAVMQVDVVFVPRPKLIRASGEGAGLKRALAKQLSESASTPKAVRRDYQLPPAKASDREASIKRVLAELGALMKEAPQDADARLGMNLTFTHLASAAGRSGADGSPPKVSYQPRQVGNDLGLWVIGTGWMALVEEVLPDGDGGGHPDEADWWVATGLGYATLGDGQRALDSFERACALEPKHELALLGRGVASVMVGSEDTAVAAYREVLRLNPKNRPAKDGLQWLLRPAAGKEPKK